MRMGTLLIEAKLLTDDLEGTGKDVWLIGGGRSIKPFHQAGLVDRWELSVIPLFLGEGVPLFPAPGPAGPRLRMTRNHAHESGIVELCYEPET